MSRTRRKIYNVKKKSTFALFSFACVCRICCSCRDTRLACSCSDADCAIQENNHTKQTQATTKITPKQRGTTKLSALITNDKNKKRRSTQRWLKRVVRSDRGHHIDRRGSQKQKKVSVYVGCTVSKSVGRPLLSLCSGRGTGIVDVRVKGHTEEDAAR